MVFLIWFIRLIWSLYEGTAGYGNTSFTIGQSYADQPVLAPIIFNPNASAGQRWTRDGLSPSTIPRMYHSSTTLLPDGRRCFPLLAISWFTYRLIFRYTGSVFVSGSNPNSDYNITAPFPTEYRVETFYPSYYNERRPEPQGLPNTLSYGGGYFYA